MRYGVNSPEFGSQLNLTLCLIWSQLLKFSEPQGSYICLPRSVVRINIRIKLHGATECRTFAGLLLTF